MEEKGRCQLEKFTHHNPVSQFQSDRTEKIRGHRRKRSKPNNAISANELRGLGIDPEALRDLETDDKIESKPKSSPNFKRLWGPADFASKEGQEKRKEEALQKRWEAALRRL